MGYFRYEAAVVPVKDLPDGYTRRYEDEDNAPGGSGGGIDPSADLALFPDFSSVPDWFWNSTASAMVIFVVLKYIAKVLKMGLSQAVKAVEP